MLSVLDEIAARILSPPLRGRVLLDAACGTAHPLPFVADHKPASSFGVDLVFEMLLIGRRQRARPRTTAAADVLALPFPSGRFDVLWCRQAAGHVKDLARLYRELARVLRKNALVIVTDFHPEAARAGHTRTLRDFSGARHAAAHVVHEAGAHEAAARAAGLSFDARLEMPVSESLRPLYERAGTLARYEASLGLPLLLAFRFRT